MRVSTASRRRLSGFLFGCVVLGCVLPAAWADPVKPTRADEHVTKIVVRLLERHHLSGRDVDDQISQRCLKTFLESLDPWKVYFYQSDVDALSKQENKLDDLAREGNVGFAHDVFRIFLQRVDERVKTIDELLAMEHDFTKDEEILRDRDEAAYTRTPAEAKERWRKRIKYDLLVLKADEVEDEKAREKLERRYHSFAKRMHQTDREELLEMYLTSMTTSFDPNTMYMSPGTVENFTIAMRLNLEGIGASLQSVDGYTVVKKIIVGGAADRQGELHVEDKIVGVGQDTDGEIDDIVDMRLSDVVKMIRGDRGTIVRLEVIPVDNAERKVITITRAKIELKDSEAQSMIFDGGTKTDGQPYKVGVVKLPSFYRDMDGVNRGDLDYKSTTRDVRRILVDFKSKDVDAVVLDLRHNLGGSLTEAIDLTGLFIDQGPVVQVKDSDGHVRSFPDRDPGTAWGGPLVVLTSKFSASASEILAGAVQDYHRGVVVGDRTTHGKGTVQVVLDLGFELFHVRNSPQMGALKVTMQQFYLPGGASVQKRGVTADLELPSLTSHLDTGEAHRDYSIEYDEVKPARFDKLPYVDEKVFSQLRQLSEQRRGGSEDFQKELKRIARYKEQKARKHITLNEAEFLKRRAELNSDKEEQDTMEGIADPNRPAIERDYYLDEALAITVDYLKMGLTARAN